MRVAGGGGRVSLSAASVGLMTRIITVILMFPLIVGFQEFLIFNFVISFFGSAVSKSKKGQVFNLQF